ncbi:MAG TPA: DHA2 family efflux MFS transporter permease subunit [Thermoleophilaceae bacterium]|nr:DHA2 family efflux MFS transporter permease subunit [Thermoleophilaceae bacterium]
MTRSQRWTIGLTSLAFFMVALDTLVVTTALPAIHRDLGAGVSTLEWTVNAYALTFAAGIVMAAALGDRLGRRRLFVIGLALFTAASGVCAIAPSAGLLLAARAVQGVGAAIVMPLSLTILTAAFPPERRGAVVGIWGAIAGLAVASGPVVGGAVTQGLDWHWIFWINVPIGVVGALLARARLEESRDEAKRLDTVGMALVTAGAFGLVWGLVRSGGPGWGSVEVLATLIGGAALLGAFAAWERVVEAPMLPPRLFADRTFAAANATAFLMTAAISAAAFLVAQYFQLGLGHSPLGAGVRLLPWTATPTLVAPVAGALSDRIGPRPIMFGGLLLQAVGLGWFALEATGGAGYGALVLPLVVAGVGISMAIPSTPAAALGAVPPSDLGIASGANSTLQRFGGVFGVAIVTAVFAAHGRLGSPAGFVAGFRPALAAAAALSLLGACTALLVRGRRSLGAPASAEPATVSA